MNVSIILFCATIAMMAVLRSTFAAEEDEKIKSMYAKCKDEVHLEEADMEVFKKMELPMSNKGKCMMACVMRESGIIVGGKFEKEIAVKLVELYLGAQPESIEKAKTVIDTCEKQIGGETDECNIAGKLAQCIMEESQKNGLMVLNGKNN